MTIFELAKRTKELAEKATPAPWGSNENMVACEGYFIAQINSTIGPTDENAEFIAHSRSAAPLLADAVIELEAEVTRLRSYLRAENHGEVCEYKVKLKVAEEALESYSKVSVRFPTTETDIDLGIRARDALAKIRGGE